MRMMLTKIARAIRQHIRHRSEFGSLGKIAIVTAWDQAPRVSLQYSPIIVHETLFAYHAFVRADSSGGDFGKLSVVQCESRHQPPRRSPCAGAFGARPEADRRPTHPSLGADDSGACREADYRFGDTAPGMLACPGSGLRCQRSQRWARGKESRGPTRERIATAYRRRGYARSRARFVLIVSRFAAWP